MSTEERRPTVLDYIEQLSQLAIENEELLEQWMNGNARWAEYTAGVSANNRKIIELLDQLEKYVRLQKIGR